MGTLTCRRSVLVGVLVLLSGCGTSWPQTEPWPTPPAAPAPTTQTAPHAPPRPFVIWDATLFKDKPPTPGMRPIICTGNFDRTEAGLRKLARQAADARTPLVLDIEDLPIDLRKDKPQAVAESLQKLQQYVEWAKREAPNLQLGYYSIMPLGEYYALMGHGYATNDPGQTGAWWRKQTPPVEQRLKDWQAASRALEPLAAKVDFICPGMYAPDEDIKGWSYYAKPKLAEARRYGKPVYPFLWFQLFGKGPTYKPLSPEFWRAQLQAVYDEGCEGVIIWGGWDFVAGRRGDWDENAPWWKVTRDFIAQHPQTP